MRDCRGKLVREGSWGVGKRAKKGMATMKKRKREISISLYI